MTRRLSISSALVATATLAFAPSSLRAQSAEVDRVAEAARVLGEVLDAPDAGVPKNILDKAEAIVVFPSTIKGAFVVGAQRGRGVISVRDKAGEWSPPAFLTLTGGSIGLQLGGQATDLVLVVMNERGMEKLTGNSFKIGGDASAAAGPVGREASASTDLTFRAEILSYSRARGLFAGVSLAGSTIRSDRDANEKIYGVGYSTKQIVIEKRGGTPNDVKGWIETLTKHLPPVKAS
ncbi:MAG: lipid-binding SYLF domain-containing protein [Vicinamibacterales bacterium]